MWNRTDTRPAELPILVLFSDELEDEYHITCDLLEQWNCEEAQHQQVLLRPLTVYNNVPHGGPAAMLVLGRAGARPNTDVNILRDYFARWGCPEFNFVSDGPSHMNSVGPTLVSLIAEHLINEKDPQ